MKLLVGVCALLALSPGARAEGPAVSELNGKLSVEGGAVGTNELQSALATTHGSITAPLGHSFGLQVDGSGSTAFNSVFGSGGLHLFWRDPAIGLVGAIAAFGGGAGTRSGLYGGEGELYAGLFTVGVRAGYGDNRTDFSSRNGGFYLGTLTVYPVPNLALSVEGGQVSGLTLGQARIEYQPDLLLAHRNVSFFVSGLAGDFGVFRATAGVQFYFGPDKSLIRRHREDDPRSFSASPMDTCVSVGGRHISVGGCGSLPQ
ncbi:hypothetical protein [Reyranella sp.]|uniref:hypothetical protein n=1 Tax=Reyranella sp. TaxID=1929291 RepID=UPI003C798DA0